MKTETLVIIGSGPAAYTAAIYAARNSIPTMLFEGFSSGIVGGQLMTTTVVENFPGFPEGILGPDLMMKMREQAEKFHCRFISEDVKKVELFSCPFIIHGTKTTVAAKSLIIATGAEAKRLDIPGSGEKEFWQKGVSACAVCDGAAPIFRNKEVFVIGGGDSAMEEAVFLTKFAAKVTIVHRREELRASKILVDRARNHPKITILLNNEIVRISGKDLVEEVVLKDVVTKKEEKRKAAGVFFAIGHRPNTEFLAKQLHLNPAGYILTKDKTTCTNIDGVFAAGDVQDPAYRQAITAAGSGCVAALDAEKWLLSQGHGL